MAIPTFVAAGLVQASSVLAGTEGRTEENQKNSLQSPFLTKIPPYPMLFDPHRFLSQNSSVIRFVIIPQRLYPILFVLQLIKMGRVVFLGLHLLGTKPRFLDLLFYLAT